MNEILKLNIGIAGCGTMGLPMLEVLLKNRIRAFGYDIRSKDNFPTLKNKFISSKTEFFDKSDIILSAVRDIDQTLELCEGHNGLFKLNTPKRLRAAEFGTKLSHVKSFNSNFPSPSKLLRFLMFLN